jgi:hypothetical protein
MKATLLERANISLASSLMIWAFGDVAGKRRVEMKSITLLSAIQRRLN